jgi:hypothetical protein
LTGATSATLIKPWFRGRLVAPPDGFEVALAGGTGVEAVFD